MIAVLKNGVKLDGFTPGKKYRYYDIYHIDSSYVSSHFFADDNDNPRVFRDSKFRDYFYGSYEDTNMNYTHTKDAANS